MIISQRICKHIAKAPRANAPSKALPKSLQSQPKRRISKFFPHAYKKKIKTRQHTGDTDRKENETNDKFNMKVQFDSDPRTDKNRQCITRYIKNWADTTEINGCSSLQTLCRFDSSVLRSAQLFIYRNRYVPLGRLTIE